MGEVNVKAAEGRIASLQTVVHVVRRSAFGRLGPVPLRRRHDDLRSLQMVAEGGDTSVSKQMGSSHVWLLTYDLNWLLVINYSTIVDYSRDYLNNLVVITSDY